MNRILVIGSLTSQKNAEGSLKLMSEFIADAVHDAEVSYCHLDEVGYYITNQSVQIYDLRNKREITEYDLVYFRGNIASSVNIASTISAYLMSTGVPTINTAYAKRQAIGKLSQMMQCAALGLHIPKTIYAPSGYLVGFLHGRLAFPVVVKDVQGAHGNDNYLVSDEAHLRRILDSNPHVEFMAQEFIPNNGDMRILVIGPEECLVIHRQGDGSSHLNNTSQGGRASLLSLSEIAPVIISESRQFAQHCGYEIAGVDVMVHQHTGEHYFLEINSQPQLANGAFVGEKQRALGSYFDSLLGS